MDFLSILCDLGLTNIQEKKHQSNTYYVCDKVAQGIEFSNFAKYFIFPIDANNVEYLDLDRFKVLQQSIVSPVYFQYRNDMRWNVYLIFVLSSLVELEASKKYWIENDDNYARKHVVNLDDLKMVVSYSNVLRNVPEQHRLDKNFIYEWDVRLSEVNLNGCLYNSFSKDAVNKYIDNNYPIRPVGRPAGISEYDYKNVDDKTIKLISEIEIDKFRDFCFGKKINIVPGLVNLFSGGNGSGKTSICEALEYGLTGEIRRNGQSKEQGSISIKYLNNAGKFRHLKSSKDLKEKKMLDNAWYGTTSNPMAKKSSLSNNFSSFNHLDAKSTVEFMLSEDANIQNIVKNIVVGEDILDCEEKWTRFEKEFIQVNGNMKKQIESLNMEVQDLRRKIQSINETAISIDEQIVAQSLIPVSSKFNDLHKPYNWDEIYSQFINVQYGVNRISNMIQTDSNMDMINIQKLNLSNQIESDKANLQLYENSLAEIKEIELQNQAKNERISQIAQSIHDIEEFYSSLTLINKQIQSENYASIIDFTKEYISKEKSLVELSKIVPSFIVNDESYVNAYDNEADTKLNEANKSKASYEIELSNKRSAISLIESENKIKSVLILQFREIIEKEDTKFCPLCGIEHETQGALVNSVNAILGQLNANNELIELTEEVSRLSNEIQSISQEINKLNQSIISTEIINDICRKANIVNASKLSSNNGANKLREIIAYMKLTNIFIEKNRLLFDNANSVLSSEQYKYFSDYSDDYTVAYNNNKQAFQNEISIYNNEIQNNEKLLAEKRKFANELQKILNVDIDLTISTLSKIDEAIKIVHQVENQFDLIKYTKFDTWIESYNKALTLIKELRLMKENNKNHQIMLSLLNSKQEEFEQIKSKSVIVSSALKVFSELPKTDNYISEFLDTNANKIEEIFSMIHRPKEFSDISIKNGKVTFIRQDKTDRIGSNQMSTGQSIALTIALIISLYSSAPNAPKLLIFDEPIANMDDLHMMNFLDLVRELAIAGTQVFITTANTDIAGLIRRKFSFFGSQFKHFDFERYDANPVKIIQKEYSPQREESNVKYIS